jgi:hypothetical protein
MTKSKAMLTMAVCLRAGTACTDAPSPHPACSTGTTPTPVSLHTRWQTQLLDLVPADATYVAVRDGEDGCGWQQVQGDGAGAYSFDVTHDTYAVVVACADSSAGQASVPPQLKVFERTISETDAVTATCAHLLPDLSGSHSVATKLVAPADDTAGDYDRYLGVNHDQYEVGGVGDALEVANYARSGSYDAVVFGHRSGAPSRLFVASGLDATMDPVVTVDLGAPGWQDLGPAISLGALLPAVAQASEADYLTSHGTFVRLPAPPGAGLDMPTWPSAGAIPGDAYMVRAWWTSDDFSRDWDVASYATDPSQFAFTTPPAFDPDAALGADQSFRLTWSFVPLPGAAYYTIDCASDHELTYNVSAGALGDGGYAFADLPTDPALDPTWASVPTCNSWTALGYGPSDGLATAALLDQIGTTPGVPAQLHGATFWRTHAQLVPPF